MTPAQFVEKWGRSELRERQGSQSHFNDLCTVLGVLNPSDADPSGQTYCFERGAEKVGGGDGWADVWRRNAFAWEYKGKHKDLAAALRQVATYARDLENPPYLVVSDMERIEVHTNWTNTVPKTYAFTLQDLLDPAKLHILRAVWEGSDELKPKLTPQDLTATVAQRFGDLGRRLQDRKEDPRAVAHFLNRLVFCMFAEDAGLLPKGLFSRTIKATQGRPAAARAQLTDLFGKMSRPGDTFFGADFIRWFNGGLFDDDTTLPLERADLELIARTAEEHDWSEIDPAVFGSLFEQALKATRERPALGAHYTDREKILKIVDPVITRPLAAEWEAVLGGAKAAMARSDGARAEREAILEAASERMKTDPQGAKAEEPKRRRALADVEKRRVAAYGEARDAIEAWLARLGAFRVLDPACGSGNFLYVALHALLDLEQRAIVDAERLGVPGFLPRVDLRAVRGLEIDRYAAELARLTLWIGYLQWQIRNKVGEPPEPVLSTLDQIENRDALLNPDGSEADWPAVDVIVGNPPFLGGKRLRENLGDAAVEKLFAAYRGHVPAEADLVAYWVEKGWRQIVGGQAGRVGLVTTNSIRGGASRRTIDPICEAQALWEAWADEPWAIDGAAVRVSMLGFGTGFVERRLNGSIARTLNSDLTATSFDLGAARRLLDNNNAAFQGVTKGAPFEIEAALARTLLSAPLNPNGRPNSDVLRPIVSGGDLVQRLEPGWALDFTGKTEAEAALYEGPYTELANRVRPVRTRGGVVGEGWWLFTRPRPTWRNASNEQYRSLVTPKVSRFRLFLWLHKNVLPDNLVVAIARDDDVTFGVLSSMAHELWSLRLGAWIGVGNDPTYTPTTTFETFPFPEGLTPNIPAADYAHDPRAQAIAEAARRLNQLREAWLNPADLTVREPEVVPGYPDRILAKDADAEKVLKTRTLTNLYNQRPAWLDMAHKTLDAAVAAAYGWPADLPDDEILERLFALNQDRAAAGR